MKSLSSLACLASLLLTLAAGCSSSVSEDASTDVNALENTSACAAQSARLDQAIARVPKDATYDAVMQVKDACGSTFHAAGPTHLDEHRLVRVGSMTKSFVAVVTLQLVAEGKVRLDEPLATYLPDAPAFAANATVRQILQHTSGIFNYTEASELWTALAADPHREIAPSELLAFAGAHAAYFAPGGGWHYSNTNYVLAGLLVEEVDGRSVSEAIRARILAPNALRETFFDGEEELAGELAPGLDQSGADVTTAYGESWAWAAGAMVSTPPDMARFVELLGSGALLPPAQQQELVTGVPTPQPGLRYGLGVFLSLPEITGGMGMGIGHGGDIMGYHSWGLYFPEKKTTVFGTVMSDRDTGNAILVQALGVLLAE